MENNRQELLKTWQESARVMHIAHLLSGARYASRHRWFGSLTAGLSALVSASAFVALQEKGNLCWLVITGLLSISAAVCTAINTFLGHDGRAKQHHHAGTLFQGVRREIEEELAFFEVRKEVSDFKKIRQHWSEALEGSPSLPQDLHDRVKFDSDSKYGE